MRLRGLNEIVSNLINNIHDKLPGVDTKEGTFIRDIFVDPVSQEISQLYQELKMVEYAQSILTATGDSLDSLASNYFIKRLGKTKANGILRFYVATGSDGSRPTNNFTLKKGTTVNTVRDNNSDEIYFVTLKTFKYYASENPTNLQYDSEGEQWYFEVEAESLLFGVQGNVSPYKISSFSDEVPYQVVSVTNPTSFSGGQDGESDASLITRIGMAILGANIGTKDGYMSLFLKQPNVSEVVVVGAGDNLMTRDIRRNNDGSVELVDLIRDYGIPGLKSEMEHAYGTSSDGNSLQTPIHDGGMVDIYVRGARYEEKEMVEYYSEIEDLEDVDHIDHVHTSNIILRNQPVKMVNNIVGKKSTISLVDGTQTIETNIYYNASNYDYEVEVDEDGNEIKRYYQDVEWSFLDPRGDTVQEIANRQLNAALKSQLSLPIIWKEIHLNKDINKYIPITQNDDFSFDFNPGYLGSELYKLQFKNDNLIDEYGDYYVFVKKSGKVFRRQSVKPSFRLQKYREWCGNGYSPDVVNYSGSIEGFDTIEWLKESSEIDYIPKPEANEQLMISYLSNDNISTLQSLVEEKRVLTANVLVKEAIPVKTIINIQVVPFVGYSFDEVIEATTNKIKTYMDSFRGMGSRLELSSLISVARLMSDGVQYVDVDHSSIDVLVFDKENRVYNGDVFGEYFEHAYVWKRKKTVSLKKTEYFDLYKINVSAISEAQFMEVD